MVTIGKKHYTRFFLYPYETSESGSVMLSICDFEAHIMLSSCLTFQDYWYEKSLTPMWLSIFLVISVNL